MSLQCPKCLFYLQIVGQIWTLESKIIFQNFHGVAYFFSTNIIKKKVNVNLILTSLWTSWVMLFLVSLEGTRIFHWLLSNARKIYFSLSLPRFLPYPPCPILFCFLSGTSIKQSESFWTDSPCLIFLSHYFLVIYAISSVTIPLFSSFTDFYFFIISKFWSFFTKKS